MNRLSHWLHAALGWIGLGDWFPTSAQIVFLGLDNAGKTTLLRMLRDNALGQAMPTQKPTMEALQMGSITFYAHDLGGHAIARRAWRDYLVKVDGVVFLVDASDATRFAEARDELRALLEEEALRGVPVAVLGNKIDVPGAADEWTFRNALEAARATMPLEVFMCSIVRRQGFREAFQWLGGVLSRR